ncbi:hypothetical protein AMTR_s00052p00166190 [Amborella trichopoda]|uniref:Uncharacterized protein n=1 Tax=Amborella trichopoda TaxID=13333 RepID=U5D4T3_AMBTC|nr:hypothetical protein AMTR_s00052p00166190 [Amborella trichopoda]
MRWAREEGWEATRKEGIGGGGMQKGSGTRKEMILGSPLKGYVGNPIRMGGDGNREAEDRGSMEVVRESVWKGEPGGESRFNSGGEEWGRTEERVAGSEKAGRGSESEGTSKGWVDGKEELKREEVLVGAPQRMMEPPAVAGEGK